MHPAPRIVVFSSLFPSSVRPTAGVFIRERMFRVGAQLPLTVVAPVPYFPLQGLIRRWRPNYRPLPKPVEEQQGFRVHYPRFLAVPGLFRTLDGLSMALCCLPLLWRLKKQGYNLIDAHFAYPDGYAATRLGRWLHLPVTITLRGTEAPQARCPRRRRLMLAALASAQRVFAVAESLKRLVTELGAEAGKIQVVGNGVDTEIFHPVDKAEARRALGLPPAAPVLISVGGLVERKGFHRVIELLPALKRRHPDLHYLVVGGGGPEGDWSARLRRQVAELGLEDTVRFLGALPPARLKEPLSAADVFVLATANEGWANVFLEAMACGLPVVTTEVGGNREVVCREDLGRIVPFGQPEALLEALDQALRHPWDRAAIIAYARANAWDGRVAALCQAFRELVENTYRDSR
ncbi:Glycosyl transferase family 1 [Candidatus Methylocalor cossyra]|uniref:Glycosyl transferase family 1 n=2 Tax=Candidatus Methylocalor cossyra TaxID=3108543 RepID=A0ABM9NMH2_9GAMM